ncbi:MAG: 3-oxoacyl-(acyl-carrier-protein) synthase 3 [Smithella sp. PtaU1.Bin162]|nr:MAG: 3-oxoacyl-(acyl-carrier-protein) synthase 3 [Smithella sp. PtaU1.Bin162]
MLYLHSLGHFNPENVISNKFLEDLDIGTNNEWILERVGIKNRRTVLALDYIKETKNINPPAAFEARQYKNSQMGAAAAKMALERAGLKPEDIGMVVSGSSSPDNIAPAEASAIAAELGIEVPSFDLNSACSSFGMEMNFLSRMQPDALPPYILVVDTECLTKSVNYSDRSVAVLFGDGSSAAIVSTSVPARAYFTDCNFNSKPSGWEKVGIDYGWHFFQDGNAVQGFAIRTSTDAIKVLQDIHDREAKRFIFIGHQANLGVLRTVCERRGIAPENHWYNVDQFGNTGCCGAPSALSMHWDEIQAGDRIAMAIVGAGLAWASLMLKVEDKR